MEMPRKSGLRSVKAAHSIFVDSSACHETLLGLSELLKELGFVVEKKRQSERTLRARLDKRRRYPLLNPRFRRASVRGLPGRAFLEITVLSKGDAGLDRRLRSFVPSLRCVFKSEGAVRSGLFVHGYFMIPLIMGKAGHRGPVDLDALGPALMEFRRGLEAAPALDPIGPRTA
jgi:hypothetical protein